MCYFPPKAVLSLIKLPLLFKMIAFSLLSSSSSSSRSPPFNSDSTAYLIGINRIINAAAIIRSNAPQLLI